MSNILEMSNIVQFDDMGYPSILCIVQRKKRGNPTQEWIDVNEKWVEEQLQLGKLTEIKWCVL